MKIKSKKRIKERKRHKPAAVVRVGIVQINIYKKRRKNLDEDGRDPQGRKRKPTYEFVCGKSGQKDYPDLRTAKAAAERIAKQTSTGNVKAAEMSDAEAKSYGRAIMLLEPTGDSLETACERYAAAVAILGMGSKLEPAAKAYVERDRLPVKLVVDVVDAMLEEKRTSVSRRTMGDLKSRLDRFAKDFSCPIATVTTSDIQVWLDRMKTGPRNKINYRNKLSVLWNWAWRRNYVLSNVVERTELPRDAGEGSAIEIYTPAELSRLIAAASNDFLPCLVIGAFAGLRTAEIQRLMWDDVNLTRGHIIASSKKVGTPSRRIIPIQPNLAQWLAPYAKRTGLVWSETEEDFFTAQGETAYATKVEANLEKLIAAQDPVKWKHNGLRHSYISYRLAALQDDAKTALEAGNSAGVIHTNYKELVTPEDATAWFAIAPKSPANVLALAQTQAHTS